MIKETRSSNELAVERTNFAGRRTMMAADRSLMAWIRTALSMISFGFTIYKLLESFQQKGGTLARENSPLVIGLFLTGLGTVAMLMGTAEYWERLNNLRKIQPIPTWRPTFIMALIMSGTGLVFFMSIITRIF
jgi:putative membrane protein